MEVPLVDEVDPAFYDDIEDGDRIAVDAVAGKIVVHRRNGPGEREAR